MLIYDQYLHPQLIEFLKATDIYISTTINPDQAVSGTLSYALGTGRAVISTHFAQAKEIVTSEVGRLVPIKDSGAYASALSELLDNKELLKSMNKKAYDQTRRCLAMLLGY
jgi:glycosyltransferase involved in cell wall biosynthesis